MPVPEVGDDMQSLRVLAWVCSLAGLFCGSLARPDLAALQLTYDQEEAQGSTLHDKGLRIVEASCEAPSDGRSLCQCPRTIPTSGSISTSSRSPDATAAGSCRAASAGADLGRAAFFSGRPA